METDIFTRENKRKNTSCYVSIDTNFYSIPSHPRCFHSYSHFHVLLRKNSGSIIFFYHKIKMRYKKMPRIFVLYLIITLIDHKSR